jgi:hypothetical protein
LHEEECGVEEMGERILIKNAAVLGFQGRKYIWSTKHTSVVFGDTQAIAGICVDVREMPKIGTNEDVEGSIFFETRPEKFLPILFGLAIDEISKKMS